jgi:hypothetical protein
MFQNISFLNQVKIWFQNRRMKWKRSRKAQQEAKNKDNRGASEDKQSSSERSSSSNSNNQTSAVVFKNGLNEKVITTLNNSSSSGGGNFQPSSQSHMIPRHLTTSSKDMQIEDNYPRHQPPTVFESDEMIWRVV